MEGGVHHMPRENQLFSTDKDAVMAWLCGLTSELDNCQPSLEEAWQYSRANRTAITPDSAIEILGADSWEQVIEIYGRYVGNGQPKDRRGKRYSEEELISIARELWQESDGRITEEFLNARAKKGIPTPTWNTLRMRLGPPRDWEKILFPERFNLPPESTNSKSTQTAIQTESTNSKSPQTAIQTESTNSKSPQTAIQTEIKIFIPGQESPIVIQITTESPT